MRDLLGVRVLLLRAAQRVEQRHARGDRHRRVFDFRHEFGRRGAAVATHRVAQVGRRRGA